MDYHLHQEQVLPIDLDHAWSFFSDPRNLDALTPPELAFRITSRVPDVIHGGEIITYRIRLMPLLWCRWVTEIKHVIDRQQFVDEQRFGPYRFWYHRHRFQAVDGGVRCTDDVHYRLIGGILARPVHALYVRRQLEHIFAYRRRKLDELFPASDDAIAA